MLHDQPPELLEIRQLTYHYIEQLLDRDSFFEINQNSSDVITGMGRIHNREIFLFTLNSSSQQTIAETSVKKIGKIIDMAVKYGKPLIMLMMPCVLEEVTEPQVGGYSEIFYKLIQANRIVPRIALILGTCEGIAALLTGVVDFNIMLNNGHQLILNQYDSADEKLGTAKIHESETGLIHFTYETEAECFGVVGYLLSFLPDNRQARTMVWKSAGSEIRQDHLNSIVPDSPKRPYDMKDVVHTIVDNGEILEYLEFYAANAITCFARINGISVGIIANQPKVLAGVLDNKSSLKIADFIRFCDNFNLPIITLVDTPGFLPGKDQEHNRIIANGAKIVYAYSKATVPTITITLRKAYGGAYIVLASKHLATDFNFAWPTAEIAVMGAKPAVEIIFRREIKNGMDQDLLIEEYTDKFSNPYVAAEKGYLDQVIEPSQTRNTIIQALRLVS